MGRALPFLSRSSWAFGFLALVKHFGAYFQSHSGLQHYIPVHLLLHNIVDHNTQILFFFSNELFSRAFAVQRLTIHALYSTPAHQNRTPKLHGRKECTGNDIPHPRYQTRHLTPKEDPSQNEIVVLVDRKSTETAACDDRNARLRHSGLSLVTE